MPLAKSWRMATDLFSLVSDWFVATSTMCFCRLLACTKARYDCVVMRKPGGTGKDARVIRLGFRPFPPTLAKVVSWESKGRMKESVSIIVVPFFWHFSQLNDELVVKSPWQLSIDLNTSVTHQTVVRLRRR